MYSVVLMMALSGGTQAVDCSACTGACTGTYVTSCTGHGHGLFSGHGCSGGGLFSKHGHSHCSGTVACCGAPVVTPVCCGGGHKHTHSACCGGGGFLSGLFSKHHHGCSGSVACTGYVGCTGSVGCTGVVTPPVSPAPPAMMTPEPLKTLPKVEKKSELPMPAPATIIVSLPAKAVLTVDGNATKSTSATRTLVTPTLETGTSYAYSLRAELDGQVIEQTIAVRAGETTNAEFSFPVQGVASR